MRLLAIDDLTLADVGIVAATDTLLTDQSQFREWSTRTEEGSGGSAFFGTVAEPAIWSFLVKCPDLAAQDALFATLTATTSNAHRLLAERLDDAGTRVVASAALRDIRLINEVDLVLELESQDSLWRAETSEVASKVFASDRDQVLPVTVPGNTVTAPQIVLMPLAQRATQSAAVGYRWRRRFTISNGADTPWYRLPLRVDLGSTTAHVTAGRAQADGDDVRLVLDGIEQERTLVGWNTAASSLWLLLPNLQPEESLTFDILSGNPAAVTPPLLAYPNVPPFSLASSSNVLWSYPMSADGAGGWYLARVAAPAAVDFTTPGAWKRVLTLDNPDNPDLYFVAPYHPQDAAAGAAVRAKFSAQRHPAKYAGVLKANAFDGVAVYHPIGITSITANFQWYNPNDLCTLVILGRESAAEPWVSKYSMALLTATPQPITPGAQSFSPAVKHVACAIWPDNGWELDPEGVVLGATANWNTQLDLALSTTGLTITVEGTWTEVYELATTLRVGGGGNAVAPYTALRVGNATGGDGAGTSRATIALTEALLIDCDAATHDVYAVGGGNLLTRTESLPAHAVQAVAGWEVP